MEFKNLNLSRDFDAVIFLTWSNWESEPRSNRYHYASRFAKNFPVIFIQNQRPIKGGVEFVQSEISNLDLINVSSPIQRGEVESILEMLRSRGLKNPLIWIYDSMNYGNLLSAMPKWMRVYHATEDYFTSSSAMQTGYVVQDSIRLLLKEVDLIVAVSESVLNKLIRECGYKGETMVSENACDFKAFSELRELRFNDVLPSPKTVLYQGGVNHRIDFKLLKSLALLLPDYKFRIAGRSACPEELNLIASLNNVELLGELSPDLVCLEMLRSEVGVIPFIQDQWIKNSFPLKFFEYIACGLPVVSVPIDALMKYENLESIVQFESTAQGFANAIQKLGNSRSNPKSMEARKKLATENSYDERFRNVASKILEVADSLRKINDPLNVAILYDPASCHVSTVREHLKAFQRYSSHDITFIPAANKWGVSSKIDLLGSVDLSLFDVAIVHYSIRISKSHHLNENFAEALQEFSGLKILFIQDEYEFVECARSWMDRLKFDLVYTCIPLEQRELVYPNYRFPHAEFLPTLTGYVPESNNIDRFALSLDSRQIAIAYRGRELPPIYGQLGHEKFIIGMEVKRLSERAGICNDISCDESDRIYGNDWYKFLGSARATLGTESGSNIFDFDGSISRKINSMSTKNGALQFDEIWNLYLKEHDGKIRMNQISPKIFEAIKLRTALVLFEGDYSGVVMPNIHYIPLKKDFSNFDQVVESLQDDKFVMQITNKAYEDIIHSGRYSYQQFIAGVDEKMQELCLRRSKRKLIFGAIYFEGNENEFKPFLPAIPLGLACAADVLDSEISLQSIQEGLRFAFTEGKDNKVASIRAGELFRNQHSNFNKKIKSHATSFLLLVRSFAMRHPIANNFLQKVYVRLPSRIKSKIYNALVKY